MYFRSRDDLVNWLPELDVQPFAAGNFQLVRVKTQLVQHRGMDELLRQDLYNLGSIMSWLSWAGLCCTVLC